jgi:dienelactone hydrolase
MDITTVTIEIDRDTISGDLSLSDRAIGMILFAHGSGSSRHSPRNRAVAAGLNRAGFGTLLLDLLTAEEEQRDLLTAEHRFDIDLLGERLVGAIDWLAEQPATNMPVGLFGASTGAAGALVAAGERPEQVGAVVSRGGRPDLAGPSLQRVAAPVLLIVGGNDPQVIELNEAAAHQLQTPHELRVVPGATHLFEEPGALEQVTELAIGWFEQHLKR